MLVSDRLGNDPQVFFNRAAAPLKAVLADFISEMTELRKRRVISCFDSPVRLDFHPVGVSLPADTSRAQQTAFRRNDWVVIHWPTVLYSLDTAIQNGYIGALLLLWHFKDLIYRCSPSAAELLHRYIFWSLGTDCCGLLEEVVAAKVGASLNPSERQVLTEQFQRLFCNLNKPFLDFLTLSLFAGLKDIDPKTHAGALHLFPSRDVRNDILKRVKDNSHSAKYGPTLFVDSFKYSDKDLDYWGRTTTIISGYCLRSPNQSAIRPVFVDLSLLGKEKVIRTFPPGFAKGIDRELAFMCTCWSPKLGVKISSRSLTDLPGVIAVNLAVYVPYRNRFTDFYAGKRFKCPLSTSIASDKLIAIREFYEKAYPELTTVRSVASYKRFVLESWPDASMDHILFLSISKLEPFLSPYRSTSYARAVRDAYTDYHLKSPKPKKRKRRKKLKLSDSRPEGNRVHLVSKTFPDGSTYEFYVMWRRGSSARGVWFALDREVSSHSQITETHSNRSDVYYHKLEGRHFYPLHIFRKLQHVPSENTYLMTFLGGLASYNPEDYKIWVKQRKRAVVDTEARLKSSKSRFSWTKEETDAIIKYFRPSEKSKNKDILLRICVRRGWSAITRYAKELRVKMLEDGAWDLERIPHRTRDDRLLRKARQNKIKALKSKP
jgi:hypothetical protein